MSQKKIKIDSLTHIIKNSKIDTVILMTYIDLGTYYEDFNTDSSLFYYQKAITLADKYLNENKSDNIDTLKWIKALAIRYCGIIFNDRGNYNKAIELYNESIDIIKKLDDNKSLAQNYANLGVTYRNVGDYDKAIELYLKALKEYELINDEKGISRMNNNIGTIYHNLENYLKAIEYYQKALTVYIKLNNEQGISVIYNNLGVIFKNLKNYDKALDYYSKAIEIREKLNDKKGIASTYNNIGIIYKIKGDKIKAMEYFQKSLDLRITLGDKQGIAMCYGNMGELYLPTDSAKTFKIKDIQKCIFYSLKSYNIAKEINALPILYNVSSNLMDSYNFLGNFKKAMEYAKVFISIKDSIYNEDKTKVITDAEKKFESEKQQLIIDKLTKEKLLQNEIIEHQKAKNRFQLVLFLSVSAGFITLIIFFIFLIKTYKNREKANRIIAQQHEELKQAFEEIRTQKETLAYSNNLLGIQNKKITDSINYAQRIQQAVLPNTKILKTLLTEYFIIYKPKDIVSGDFYWVSNIGDWTLAVVGDCTGHGVPGAFMSMLGIAFLNDIVKRNQITSAADVLNLMRETVIESLNQKDLNSQTDGMDMSIVVINKTQMKAQWAGANNPLWVVRSNLDDQTEDKVEILKPDRMPVSIHLKMESFVNNEFEIADGDTLYLFSDGIYSQIGGQNGTKYNIKNFRNLLAKNSSLPLIQQKEIIENEISDWMNQNNNIVQTDDITVLGFRV